MAAKMGRAVATALLGLLVTVGGVPLALAGGHMTTYHMTTDHDDLGRSNEPDGASSGVLGMPLDSCNVDATLNGQCEVYASAPQNPVSGARVLAPGCWGDAGRQASGLCFLAVKTGGVVGEAGMGGNAAPGSFTPTKGTAVRFFDLVAYVFPMRGFIDHNNKLRDLGVSQQLASLDANFGSDAVAPGVAGFSAWYGNWQDKNGNGVIDYLGSADATPVPGNEFQWIGACGATIPAECSPQPTSAPVWFYPGNHHAFATPDLPGLQLACFVSAAAQNGVCSTTIEGIDEADEDFQGDPLLGPQGSVKADSFLDDRTDDPLNARHYVMGNGFPLWHYDQSIVVSEVVIAAVNPGLDPGHASGYDPAAAQFRDVDSYRTWSPVLEDLVQVQLKPAVRGPWTGLMSAYGPFNSAVDAAANNQDLDLTPTTGPLDDAVSDPGRSREPNSAGDQYPGASRGVCPGNPDATHEGMCNRYAAHALGPHAFADLQLFRSAFLVKPSVAGIGAPLIYGPQPIDGGAVAAPPRAAGDHGRSLGPGIYDPLGNIGVWRDKAHAMHEATLDVVATVTGGGSPQFVTYDYVVGTDGWVGNVVNSTSQWRYRGYEPEVCTIFGVSAQYEHAQCDPYSDGAGDDPQDYGTSDGEFDGRCTGAPTLTLRPDSIWTQPTFVWRDLETFEVTNIRLEDHTGTSDPITLKLECISGIAATTGGFVGRDMLILPLGNPGMGVTSTLDTGLVPISDDLSERVVDVDYYRPA